MRSLVLTIHKQQKCLNMPETLEFLMHSVRTSMHKAYSIKRLKYDPAWHVTMNLEDGDVLNL